ncbi:hypothetical protein ONZ45_g10612 [Pleurotus djamor]|nr:hypothetical protein ONZ45_g10612 [Pleurotus djamor]
MNPQLASHTTSLVDFQTDSDPVNHVHDILPHLINLKRLFIGLGRDIVLESIPSCVQLTHFSCPSASEFTPSIFQSFLHSQCRSLRYLSLESGMVAMEQIFPPSLERLSTLKAVYPHSWDTIVQIAPIKHLSVYLFHFSWIRDPHRVFTNLVSLKIRMLYEINVIDVIGPYLNSLRLLHLSPMEDMVTPIGVENLMKISSPFMTYIHFDRYTLFGTNTAYKLEDVQPLYDKYPSLVAIDIAYEAEQHRSNPTITRYLREGNEITCKLAIIHPPWTFDIWWESLEAQLNLDI